MAEDYQRGLHVRVDGGSGLLEKPAFAEQPAKRHAGLFVILCCFGLVLLALWDAAKAYDNDMWWILATGREIVSNGIPYTNPFSMFEGLGIVVQQWLSCVIVFVLYDSFGMLGCQVLVFFQQVALAACLYALCQMAKGAKGWGAEVSLLLVLLAFGSIQAYASVRPHLYTMTFFVLIMIVLERYRRTHQRALLVAIPLLVCVHVNFHSSMAPYDLVIMGAYLLPNVPALLQQRGRSTGSWCFFEADYPRIPLLVAFAASTLALLINPYGIDGALYLVNSYGAADYRGYINEMGATSFCADYGICAMACMLLGSVAVGANGTRRINLPLTLLFAVAIPLTILHTRNVWLVSVFSVPLISQAFSGVSLWHPALARLHQRGACLLATVILAGGLGYLTVTYVVPEATSPYEEDSGSTPCSAADYLDEYVSEQGIAKADLKIYNSFNNGGYLEWRGYKVFIDARPELWEPAITGVDQHIYRDFVDFAQNGTTTRQLLENYTFDFMVVYSDCTLASDLAKRTDYEVVVSSVGYRLWKRVGA